jgi:hypothetical protein
VGAPGQVGNLSDLSDGLLCVFQERERERERERVEDEDDARVLTK